MHPHAYGRTVEIEHDHAHDHTGRMAVEGLPHDPLHREHHHEPADAARLEAAYGRFR